MRKLTLAICDYNDKVVCDLYDNRTDVSGQAYDVHRISERNGWKELSFSVPSVMHGDSGEEENYRLRYLIADYKIRFEDDYETDWYVLSGEKITHKAFSKDINVTAGHISQRLKMKNLDLEFSDEEGNNVGTALSILTTVLEGTGWTPGNVATFYEDDGVTEKVRSMKASAKTGAFKLITMMCELFEAKPIFHGDTKTVDILPLNPFAREVRVEDGHIYAGRPIRLEPGEIPSIVQQGTNIIELHYDKNVKGISRTLNTENLVSKLYAYGSYGDTTDGLCSLQKVKHNEYKFNIETPNIEYKFYDIDHIAHYFTAGEAGEYIWSDMDPTSRSYVWHDHAYRITNEPVSSPMLLADVIPEAVENHFPYLLDFDYFDEVGLLSEEMFQKIAEFQRNMPEFLIKAEEASKAFTLKENEVSITAESMTGLAKLDITSYARAENGVLRVNLSQNSSHRIEAIDAEIQEIAESERTDKETAIQLLEARKAMIQNNDEPYVIYRTDYDAARRNRFTWHAVNKLKENGDPVSGAGSVLFIVHDTEPVTWEMAYVHQIDERYHYETIDGVETKICDDYVYGISEGQPEYFTLWIDYRDVPELQPTDRFYLLCTKSMTGYLGAKQVEDEAAVQTLTNSTKTVTETHPTYFEIDTGTPTTSISAIENSYGWCYLYNPFNYDIGKLYFCYGYMGDRKWKKAYCQMTEPEGEDGEYFLNTKTKEFFHKENGVWKQWNSTDDKRIANQFSKVNYYCLRRDMLYKGLYEKYTVNTPIGEPGNYAIRTDFGFYWVFTTDRPNNIYPEPIRPLVDTTEYTVYQAEDVNSIVSVDTKPFDTVEYPSENLIAGINFATGTINNQGADETNKDWKRSYNISIYELTNYEFNLPEGSKIFIYDHHKELIGIYYTSEATSFRSPKHAYFLRIASPTLPESTHYVRVYNYNKLIYVDDKLYTVLEDIVPSGLLKGINFLTKQFADLTDEAYENYLPSLLAAQKVVNDKNNELSELLGDVYREGWWQNPDYVEGDEAKLYKDTLDNLMEIAKPEATYDVEFLDLYEAEDISEDNDAKWPDVQDTDAAHLIDPEINVNLWAYLDKVDKCYDKPWLTNITLNTNLSLIGQHSFTDVMSRIADIANQTKARQEIYERASTLGPKGEVVTQKLQGTIQLNANKLNSGATNWYTDDQGAMIFESADDMSAMKITGSGFGIASSKNSDGDWEWNNSMTGLGLTADVITTGTLRAKLIEAGAITADKLHSSVGQELEIGSNKALELFATIDGDRPAGSLLTTDALIEIKAGDNDNPAAINVLSGGVINMQAGSDFSLKSGGNFSIESGAELTIRSNNLNIYKGEDGQYHADFLGEIITDEGTIGGWTIKEGQLHSGASTSYVELNSDANQEYVIYAGSETYANAPFRLLKDGSLYASTGEFSGTITATDGKIGGWIIDSSGMHKGDMYIDAGSSESTDPVIHSGSYSGGSYDYQLQNDGTLIAKKLYIGDKSISEYTNGVIESKGYMLQADFDGFLVEYNSDYSAMDTKFSTKTRLFQDDGSVNMSAYTVNEFQDFITGAGISVSGDGTLSFAGTDKIRIDTDNFKLNANGDGKLVIATDNFSVNENEVSISAVSNFNIETGGTFSIGNGGENTSFEIQGDGKARIGKWYTDDSGLLTSEDGNTWLSAAGGLALSNTNGTVTLDPTGITLDNGKTYVGRAGYATFDSGVNTTTVNGGAVTCFSLLAQDTDSYAYIRNLFVWSETAEEYVQVIV